MNWLRPLATGHGWASRSNHPILNDWAAFRFFDGTMTSAIVHDDVQASQSCDGYKERHVRSRSEWRLCAVNKHQ